MKSKPYLRPLLGLVFACLLTLVLTTPSYAELSVESYCQLNIGIAQQEADYLSGLLVLTQKYCEEPNFLQAYCNNPNSFLEQKQGKQAEFDKTKTALFNSFNTTAEEYNTFKAQNAQAVADYLNNDPNTAQAIDDLTGRINSLSERLKVPSYCLTSIAVVRQELGSLNELIALAQQYSNDPNTFLQQEQLKRKEFDRNKEVLLASFGTTTGDYIAFMGKNKQQFEQYLNNHPGVKQTIDNLTGQLNALLEKYETLRASIIKTGAMILGR